MQSIAVEYLRFGDETGIARLSEKYLRTVRSDSVATVTLGLAQDHLENGMQRLDYVNYKRGNPGAVRDAAEDVLAQLIGILDRFLPDLPATGPGPMQVEIVTEAQELSQLPFEVLEEKDEALIVTRRIRQPWPLPSTVNSTAPRVLFAWAEPKGMKVPHERHRALLDSFLMDWGDAIVELANASIAGLKEKIRGDERGFTHIYLLAHGIGPGSDVAMPFDLTGEPPPSTYLALQQGNDFDRCAPKDLGALFTDQTRRPAAFILATCDSGRVNPIKSGGTLAHALHRAGVPVVVASQFELTQAGSDRLIDVFLKQIVAGEDPRTALHDTRKSLRASTERTFYDRVAVVGYIHLEADFEARLAERKLKIALDRLKAISGAAGREISKAAGQGYSGPEDIGRWQRLVAKFDELRLDLNRLEDKLGGDATLRLRFEAELRGLVASSLRREAEAAWRLSQVVDEKQAAASLARSRELLSGARRAYERAARPSRDRHWVWVQWLALKTVFDGALPNADIDWSAAYAAAGDDDSCWGLGSLIELQLLATWKSDAESQALAEELMQRLVERCVASEDGFPIDSTLEQLARYRDWWSADEIYRLPSELAARAAHYHDFLSRSWKARSGETMTAFAIEMMPANEGDALWIEYAAEGEPTRHLLIDCGRSKAYRTAADKLEDNPDLKLELFVLTHVDTDHITGAVRLLQDARLGPDRVKDVWYNGWPQLEGNTRGVDIMGAQQGEYFGAVLLEKAYPWNRWFNGNALVVTDDAPLPVVTLAGGLVLTLLSPTPDKLDDMRRRWVEDLGGQGDHRRIDPGDWERALEVLSRDRGYQADIPLTLGDGERVWPPDIQALAISDFVKDASEPNGSSIAFLAELGDKAVLFAGDAHAPVLEQSIRRLLASRQQERLHLDAYKMSHHGSARNNSLELAQLIDCPLFLVSTDGARHHHPDPEALSRMIWAQQRDVTFAFNYRTPENENWRTDTRLQQEFGYSALYPERGEGLRLEL